MARNLTAQQIGAKWNRVVQTRQQDYDEGISDPSVDWAGPAAAAASTYAAGVQEAVGRGAFEAGVRKAGDEKWRRKTRAVGAQRWQQGVSAGESDFITAFAPVLEVIEQTRAALPPRRPRGDPANFQRSNQMAQALAEFRKRN